MRVVMLTASWCQACATMKRILGDRVETIDITENPEWVEKTTLTSTPTCMIMDGDTMVSEKAGFMPISAFERWVGEYANS